MLRKIRLFFLCSSYFCVFGFAEGFNCVFKHVIISESWFTVDEKTPIAYAKVEIVEAADMKPSDLNGKLIFL